MSWSQKHGKHVVFLELLSGAGRFSQVVKKGKYGVISIDARHGPSHDLCEKSVLSIILGWPRGHCIAGVWLGTPCSSWSRARHDIDGHGPRTRSSIYGCSGLSTADQIRVELGNQTMRTTAIIIKKCSQLIITVCLENPHSSLLWFAPEIARLVPKGISTTSDFCQYGTPWRKRTRVVAWNFCSTQGAPDLTCNLRHGVCARTHIKHVILTGRCSEGNIPWAQLAEPYPRAWCAHWFKAFENSIVQRALHKFMKFMC